MKNLQDMLIEAGYPKEEMDHHCSDLYVYKTPLSERVIRQYCQENNLEQSWNCPTFIDQITGRIMYDCAFCWRG